MEHPPEAQHDESTKLAPQDNTNEDAKVTQQVADLSAASAALPSPKKSSHKVMFIVLGIVFFAAVTAGTFLILHAMQTKINTSSKPSSNVTAQKPAATTQTDTKIDDTVKEIDAGVATNDSDTTSADDSLSDSNQQITVPTE